MSLEDAGAIAGAAIGGLILGLLLGALIVILITRKLKIDWSKPCAKSKPARSTGDEPVPKLDDIEAAPGVSRSPSHDQGDHDTVGRMLEYIQSSIKEKEASPPQTYHPTQRPSLDEHSQEEENPANMYELKQPYQPASSDSDGSDSDSLDDDREHENDKPPHSPSSNPESTESSDIDGGDTDGLEGLEEQPEYANDNRENAFQRPLPKERCATPPPVSDSVSDSGSEPDATRRDSHYLRMDGNVPEIHNADKSGDNVYIPMDPDPRAGSKRRDYDSGVASTEYPGGGCTYSIVGGGEGAGSEAVTDDIYEEHDPEAQDDFSYSYATPRGSTAIPVGEQNDGFQSDEDLYS